MIIARFGSTYAGAYQFPTYQAVDDWQISRPAVLAQVGGMSGAFDFYGDSANPLAPMVVRKSIMVTPDRSTYTGTGTVTKPTNGTATIYGSGTNFIGEVLPGDVLTINTHTYTVTAVLSDTSLNVTPTTGTEAGGSSFTITPVHHYNRLDIALDALKAATINVGESKLWGLLRDGSYRWAWAKCTGLRPPERYTVRMALPVDLEFTLREGLWYGATENSLLINSQATGYDFTLTNAGNHTAYVRGLIDNGDVSALGSFKLKNHTNGYEWTFDSVATLHDVIVNAASYTATDNGTDAYADLTVGAIQESWMQLEPGANTMEVTFTGAPPLYSFYLYWYDTYL